MEKMTKTSTANLGVCDKSGYTPVDGSTGVMVWVERLGNRAYLCGTTGPLVYENKAKARRAVKRLRPDLEPTDI